VILRCFETLPVIARGEDVDLLVVDDLAKIDDLFVRLRPACTAFAMWTRGAMTMTRPRLWYAEISGA
jgi:hypothetical protein